MAGVGDLQKDATVHCQVAREEGVLLLAQHRAFANDKALRMHFAQVIETFASRSWDYTRYTPSSQVKSAHLERRGRNQRLLIAQGLHHSVKVCTAAVQKDLFVTQNGIALSSRGSLHHVGLSSLWYTINEFRLGSTAVMDCCPVPTRRVVRACCDIVSWYGILTCMDVSRPFSSRVQVRVSLDVYLHINAVAGHLLG
jgi:hypothetical protein